jgi:hypothetical protein
VYFFWGLIPAAGIRLYALLLFPADWDFLVD